MIALGSGEATRTICSTLIAEAFGRVEYPILPRIESMAVEARGILAWFAAGKSCTSGIIASMRRPTLISHLISRL